MRPRPATLLLALAGVAAALAACAPAYRAPPPESPVNVAYSCDDGRRLVVRFQAGDRATLRVVDGPVHELRATAPGGSAFAGANGVGFAVSGRDATVDMGDGARVHCRGQG